LAENGGLLRDGKRRGRREKTREAICRAGSRFHTTFLCELDVDVVLTWRVDKSDVYLLDVFRGRLDYPDLRRKVIALAQLHRPATILIEDAGPGMSLLQDLRNSMPAGLIRPLGVRPVGDKVDRMAAQSAKFEAGQVHLAKDAHWHAEFLSESLAFPNGRHDDQVDSVSQLLTWRQNLWMQTPQLSIVNVPFEYSQSWEFHEFLH